MEYGTFKTRILEEGFVIFRVEIVFKPDLDDVSKYTAATDAIFAGLKMPCLHSTEIERVYGDAGNPKDIGILYAAVNKIRLTPWIVPGINDAYFDNGRTRDTLMTNFFASASRWTVCGIESKMREGKERCGP
ncbi:MAG: hypothetical protein LBP73_00930 [Clostridiales Family XIII bacterium]|jgi:hypothetical protein|nr:hypothetical protein [Clostridiales Family XIII bacterium]